VFLIRQPVAIKFAEPEIQYVFPFEHKEDISTSG
jgi:hypothetical protein